MVSGKHKKAPSLYKRLQLLRSIITNSHARSRSPNILDNQSKYVQEFMELKAEKINQDKLTSSQNSGSSCSNSIFPVVKVEAQETGFVIEVFTERSCSGLLVFILEAFEELGLDVLHARVSSSHNFHLEAVAITNDNKQSSEKDAQRIEQAMFQAFQSWSEVNQNQTNY